jgi:hypothetical protein
MEDAMRKSLLAVATAFAAVSAGSLISDGAQAGGSTSAASKYNNATYIANLHQARNRPLVEAADFRITEFSSSSARSPVAKR